MPYLDITNRQRTNAFEWKYTMLLCNDDGSDATQLAGSRVVESFGRPRIYRNKLRDSDLDPQFETAHRGSASYVCSRMETGRAGRFKVERMQLSLIFTAAMAYLANAIWCSGSRMKHCGAE